MFASLDVSLIVSTSFILLWLHRRITLKFTFLGLTTIHWWDWIQLSPLVPLSTDLMTIPNHLKFEG